MSAGRGFVLEALDRGCRRIVKRRVRSEGFKKVDIFANSHQPKSGDRADTDVKSDEEIQLNVLNPRLPPYYLALSRRSSFMLTDRQRCI